MDSEFKKVPYQFFVGTRTGHPLLLVGRRKRKIAYLSMEHTPTWGTKKNVRFDVNPAPSYFRKKVFVGDSSELGKSLESWSLTKEDKEKVDEFLSKVGKWWSNEKGPISPCTKAGPTLALPDSKESALKLIGL